jgi:hypothetical protein
MLLILGNGFDLLSGLETDYQSFFQKRYENEPFVGFQKFLGTFSTSGFENFLSTYCGDYLEDLFQTITIWDMVLINERILTIDHGWSNIENIIRKYIVNNLITLNSLRNQNKAAKDDDDRIVYLDKLFKVINALMTRKKLSFSPLQFNQWLLDQLKLLESAFSNYVSQQVKCQKTYNDNANEILKQLFRIDSTSELSVISFNYTVPNLRYTNKFGMESTVKNHTNVHGTIKDKVIFGIDEKSNSKGVYLDPSDSKYMFTKTARRFHNFEHASHFQLFETETSIVVFGHSLNPQDYSYYQSIFDHYNIYGSKLKLIFVWYNYERKKKLKAEMVDKICQLLKQYGDTMTNKDNGKNLLHKLLLENRLEVRELSKPSFAML